MPLHECPGPHRHQPLTPVIVECPKCGEDVELWSDETEKKCPDCATLVKRDGTAAE